MNEAVLEIPFEEYQLSPHLLPYYMFKKTNHYTHSEIKLAYQIVQQDLFHQLLKAQAAETVKFGNLGNFKKTEQMVNSKSYGQHVYYKLSFRCFSKLKAAFHSQLSKKYKL